jgi:hypothetical protein
VSPEGEANLTSGSQREFRFARRGRRKEDLRAQPREGTKSKEGAFNQYGATSAVWKDSEEARNSMRVSSRPACWKARLEDAR